MTNTFQRIAIIGGGPSGCALACFLQMRGIACVVFDSDKTPSLMVGESLVPAAMPIIRRLGIEERVAAISQIKRGAALRHGNGNRVDFKFQASGRKFPDYAYNIPRPRFDRLVRERAEELGVKFVSHCAQVELVQDDPQRELQLDAMSLSAAGLDRSNPPDLLIDATGRKRRFSRKLDLPCERGPRNDVAYFAHFKDFENDARLDGQVLISALNCGWSWQIPLPGLTSVGVVMDARTARAYGESPAERLDNAIRQNALLASAGANSTRVSEVMTYSNYQLMAGQAHGKGWVLLGDALGFVDPMLSPGVFMALESAVLLDRLVLSQATQDFDKNCAAYYSQMRSWHKGWSELIEYFYDGRILSMGEMRNQIRSEAGLLTIGRYAEPLVSRVLSQLVSGIKTRSSFSRSVLHHSCRHLIRDQAQKERNRILDVGEGGCLNSKFDLDRGAV